MSDQQPKRPMDLSSIVDQFDQRWRTGEVPDLGTCLEQAASQTPTRRELLLELIAVDLEYRWKGLHQKETASLSNRGPAGPWLLEKYVERFAELDSVEDLPTELITEEYRVRHRWGDQPAHDEYARRFPTRAEKLKLRLARIDVSLLREGGQQPAVRASPVATLPISQDGPAGEVPAYEILEELGRGGMGVVYRARQVKAQRVVALKRIRAGTDASAQELLRFRIEAEAIASLQHPNIVQIYEVGEHQSLPFFSLEFCSGGSLAAKLAQKPLSVREAAELVETLARAVHAAHDKGIIHRDLKPGNVLLTEQGVPKVADFGLARRVHEGQQHTHTGAVMGTPAYMAPEQARGDIHAIGPWTDVYALGVILYECLTGQTPFAGPSDVVMFNVQYIDPPTPRQYQQDVPRAVETICLKCLAKEPQRRYASAQELAEDLRRFLHHEPIKARPMGWMEKLVLFAQRRPAVAGVLILTPMTLVILLALILVSLLWWRADDARAEAIRERARAEELANKESEARKQVEQLANELDRTLYERRISLAQARWREGKFASMRRFLDECPQSQRHWEWHYLNRLCRQKLVFRGHNHVVGALAYHPGGNWLASASWDRTVQIWDPQTGKIHRTLTGARGPLHAVVFSPDGKRLAAAGSEGVIRLWDAHTGKKHLELRGRAGIIRQLSFHPTRPVLASAGLDMFVHLWDVQKGKQLEPLRGHRTSVLCVAHSADGKFLASGDNSGIIKVWDGNTAVPLFDLKSKGFGQPVQALAFDPTGQWLASSGQEKTIRVWDLNKKQQHRLLPGHADWVTTLAYHPEGKLLVSAARNKSIKVWDISTAREVLNLKGHEEAIPWVVFHPDGQTLASASGDRTARVWDVRLDLEARVLSTGDWVNSVAFSPDSKRLAVVNSGKNLWVYDARLGTKQHTLVGHDESLTSVVFDPSGKYLASASDDQTIKTWDANTGKEIRTFKGHEQGVLCVRYTPDGANLISASSDHSVRVWDARTGKHLSTLRAHTDAVRCLAVSSDGLLLASGSGDRTVRIWDLKKGKVLHTLKGHTLSVGGVAFTPESHLLASSADDHLVKLWDADTGKELRTFKGATDMATAVVFTPDGKRLVSTSADRTVRIWDPHSGTELLRLQGHAALVSCVAFSPDGCLLATGSWDNTVRIHATPSSRAR